MLRKKPRIPEISPFSGCFLDMEAMMVIQNRAIRKYSREPNWRERRASGEAMKRRERLLNCPPTQEAMVTGAMARPASPRLAMGLPSSMVTQAEGVPGMLSRMAVMEPP